MTDPPERSPGPVPEPPAGPGGERAGGQTREPTAEPAGEQTGEQTGEPVAVRDRRLARARTRTLARLRLLTRALGPALGRARWVSARRTVVTAVSYGLLGLAFVLGVSWFIWPENARWEPAVNSLTLVAGLTGIFVERLSAEAERRTEVLRAVAEELQENTRLLSDERFSPDQRNRRQVYPRLVVSAVDLALVSGALGRHRDAELVGLLHRWRDTVHLFNRRLDLTEISTFSPTISPEELAAFHRALHRENSYFAATREMLETLLARLPPP